MDTDYSDLTKSELEELAAERGLEVTRSDGERGEPLHSDYVAALEAHDEASAVDEPADEAGSDSEEEAADEAGDQDSGGEAPDDDVVSGGQDSDPVLRNMAGDHIGPDDEVAGPAPADDIPNEGDRVKVELDDGQEHEAFLRGYAMGAVLVLRDGADTEKFVRASDVELVARAPETTAAPAEA